MLPLEHFPRLLFLAGSRVSPPGAASPPASPPDGPAADALVQQQSSLHQRRPPQARPQCARHASRRGSRQDDEPLHRQAKPEQARVRRGAEEFQELGGLPEADAEEVGCGRCVFAARLESRGDAEVEEEVVEEQ